MTDELLGSNVPKLLTAKHRRDVSAASLVMHETEILFTQGELDWAADEGSFLLVMIAELMELAEEKV